MAITDYFEWNIIVGFLYGYAKQSLEATIMIFGVGFVITLLATLPPWPIYNRKPVKWLPVASESEDQADKR
ncbi:Signal peptidase complex subunit 1 [Umbelopsis nana]